MAQPKRTPGGWAGDLAARGNDGVGNRRFLAEIDRTTPVNYRLPLNPKNIVRPDELKGPVIRNSSESWEMQDPGPAYAFGQQPRPPQEAMLRQPGLKDTELLAEAPWAMKVGGGILGSDPERNGMPLAQRVPDLVRDPGLMARVERYGRTQSPVGQPIPAFRGDMHHPQDGVSYQLPMKEMIGKPTDAHFPSNPQLPLAGAGRTQLKQRGNSLKPMPQTYRSA